MWVDLNDLLDSLTRNPVTLRRSRVRGYNDTALEAEGQSCRSVGNLYRAFWVGVVVCHCSAIVLGRGSLGAFEAHTGAMIVAYERYVSFPLVLESDHLNSRLMSVVAQTLEITQVL